MSRDYKPAAEKSKNTSKGSPFLTGLLVGFLLGVAASLAVVMFVKGDDSPFANNSKLASSKIPVASTDVSHKASEESNTNPATPENKPADDKTRFDFYTILPGSESKVSREEEIKIKEEAPQPVQKSYFLQVGAFQTDEEADNMKAKLALQGFEAVVQTATIPEKGVWHRVRVGPLKDLDQINKTKKELIINGFNADLIKVNNDATP